MNKMSSQEILYKLIAFDTVSSNSNMEMIQFILDYLEKFGVSARLVRDLHEDKANLFAVIGPKNIPGIMLSGHTDVVPVEGQKWSSGPFEMTERNGRLYGRGSCDMKGFIACVLAKVPEFVAVDLKEPIYLAFSYDEETGCTGVDSLVDVVNELSVKPRACIVGEPTSMKVLIATKVSDTC